MTMGTVSEFDTIVVFFYSRGFPANVNGVDMP
jgi:hypothetical protein